MPAPKPIEYAKALEACDEAWKAYDHAIDAEAPRAEIERLARVAEALDNVKHALYMLWQAKGGTSDIKSLFD